jgi:hypothetical protein
MAERQVFDMPRVVGRCDRSADHGAPSLGVRHLSRAKIREIIRCGRADMPYFDRFAYTDNKPCYDKTAKELGNQMPDRSPVTLQPYEIDPLADYVVTKIMGAGAVTSPVLVWRR